MEYYPDNTCADYSSSDGADKSSNDGSEMVGCIFTLVLVALLLFCHHKLTRIYSLSSVLALVRGFSTHSLTLLKVIIYSKYFVSNTEYLLSNPKRLGFGLGEIPDQIPDARDLVWKSQTKSQTPGNWL